MSTELHPGRSYTELRLEVNKRIFIVVNPLQRVLRVWPIYVTTNVCSIAKENNCLAEVKWRITLVNDAQYSHKKRVR